MAVAGASKTTMWYDALAVAIDGVRQSSAAPGGNLDDLAAVGGDLAGRAIDDRGDPLVRRIRTENEHEFVAAHGRIAPSCGDAPLADTSDAEPKGNGRGVYHEPP